MMMGKEINNKKYSFRLTNNDTEVYQFLESSKKTNSETIRELLRFAISKLKQMEREQKRNNIYLELQNELVQIKELQEKHHTELIEKLNKGIIVSGSEEESESECGNEVSESIENSIDSMLHMFGMDDE